MQQKKNPALPEHSDGTGHCRAHGLRRGETALPWRKQFFGDTSRQIWLARLVIRTVSVRPRPQSHWEQTQAFLGCPEILHFCSQTESQTGANSEQLSERYWYLQTVMGADGSQQTLLLIRVKIE